MLHTSMHKINGSSVTFNCIIKGFNTIINYIVIVLKLISLLLECDSLDKILLMLINYDSKEINGK